MARETYLTQNDSKLAIDTMLRLIEEEVRKGNRVELRNFGVFEPKTRKARACNTTLKQGQFTKGILPERRTIKFKVSPKLQAEMTEAKQINDRNTSES